MEFTKSCVTASYRRKVRIAAIGAYLVCDIREESRRGGSTRGLRRFIVIQEAVVCGCRSLEVVYGGGECYSRGWGYGGGPDTAGASEVAGTTAGRGLLSDGVEDSREGGGGGGHHEASDVSRER